MLNIKFEGNGKQAVIMASGSLGDILAELSMTVSGIYKQMKKSAPPCRGGLPASIHPGCGRSQRPHVERGAEGRLWHDERDACEAEGW